MIDATVVLQTHTKITSRTTSKHIPVQQSSSVDEMVQTHAIDGWMDERMNGGSYKPPKLAHDHLTKSYHVTPTSDGGTTCAMVRVGLHIHLMACVN